MIISPPKPTRTERLLLLLAFVMLLIMILMAAVILRNPVAQSIGVIEGENVQIADASDSASLPANPASTRTLTPIMIIHPDTGRNATARAIPSSDTRGSATK